MKSMLPRAALAALALEAIAVGGVALTLSRDHASAQSQQTVMLSFPAAAEDQPPAPHPKPDRRKPAPPDPAPEPQAAEHPPVAAPPAAIVAAAPASSAAPAASAEAAVADAFRAQVKSAVQSAVNYPYAAQTAHISGKAQVSFSYRDSQVADPKIIVSSGYRMLDEAALAAVKSAAYPSPPPELSGKPLLFVVWVRFYERD